MHNRRLFLLLAIAFITIAFVVSHWPSRAADDPPLRPGRLPTELRRALEPGLILRLRSKDDSSGFVDVRQERLAALYLPAGEPPSAFLRRGPFQAEFSGYLRLRLGGDYKFRLHGRGTAELFINEQSVAKLTPGEAAKPVTATLVKGYNQLAVNYQSEGDGSAQLRVYWSSDEIPEEPLPPDQLWHDPREADLAERASQRHGRMLVAQLNCFRCHERPKLLGEVNSPMPEVDRDTPSLAGAGSRFTHAWMWRWMQQPHAMRDRVLMPAALDVLPERERLQAASDIASFLAGLKFERPPGAGARENDATDKKLTERGLLLYETRGCIACHRFTPPKEEDPFGRISLHFAGAKFQPGAMAENLRDTHEHYRWRRMPQFTFTNKEATALAAYVRKNSRGLLPAAAFGDADRGQRLFAQVGCAACHATSLGGRTAPQQQKPLWPAKSLSGCLADSGEKRGPVPDFALSAEDRAAIISFLKLKGGEASLGRRVPIEFSRRQVEVMNCKACHRRDRAEDLLTEVIVEESEIGLKPDPIPALTFVGEKIKNDWTRRLLTGKIDSRLRDYFRTHMPALPARGETIAVGLGREHGFAPTEDIELPADAESAKTGEKIAAMQGGLACNRCHAVGDVKAQAPDQAQAPNLTRARDRLRYEYYRRWMLFPQRAEPRTRMIRFAADNEKTQLTRFYDGDALKQYNALWRWLGVLAEKETATVE